MNQASPHIDLAIFKTRKDKLHGQSWGKDGFRSTPMLDEIRTKGIDQRERFDVASPCLEEHPKASSCTRIGWIECTGMEIVQVKL
jgi:hypothetical protein